MTTIANVARPAQPLRRVLQIDAALCLVAGAGLAALGGSLAGLTGIPADVAQPVGLFLMAWGAWIGYTGSRAEINRRAAQIVMVVNFAWVLASLLLLFGGLLPLTTLGWWFVAIQALAVDLIAVAQVLALRRAN
jgi:hypothetical protein